MTPGSHHGRSAGGIFSIGVGAQSVELCCACNDSVMSRESGVQYIFPSRATSSPEVWRLAQSILGSLVTG